MNKCIWKKRLRETKRTCNARNPSDGNAGRGKNVRGEYNFYSESAESGGKRIDGMLKVTVHNWKHPNFI